MPPAPCSTGSKMIAASSSAWCSQRARGTRRPTHGTALAGAGGRSAKTCCGQHAGEHRVHPADRVAHAHRAEGVAVVAAAQRQHPGLARVGRCPRWYCTAILSATSTLTEPESAKNTCSSPSGVDRDEPLGQVDRRLVGEAAEHHVRHRRPGACSAASSSGWRYPWIADHHDDIASMSRCRRRPARRWTPARSVTRRAGDRVGHRGVGVPEVRAVEGEQRLASLRQRWVIGAESTESAIGGRLPGRSRARDRGRTRPQTVG